VIRGSGGSDLAVAKHRMLKVERTRDLKEARRWMVLSKRKPHGQRGTNEVAVKNVRPNTRDQLTKATEEHTPLMRLAHGQTVLAWMDCHADILVSRDERPIRGHHCVHINAELHELAHLP
jgi:hypothetical protein